MVFCADIVYCLRGIYQQRFGQRNIRSIAACAGAFDRN
jgi:hypothetical protein